MEKIKMVNILNLINIFLALYHLGGMFGKNMMKVLQLIELTKKISDRNVNKKADWDKISGINVKKKLYDYWVLTNFLVALFLY